MADKTQFQGSSFNPGSIVWRLLVPAWIATGAIFKLISASPSTLPESLLDLADDLGVGLYQWLGLLVGLEFLAIGVMLFVKPLARLMAVFMLASFCTILVIEMAVYGNVTSCGCMGGSVKLSPLVMIGIDGALLLATLALGRKPLGLLARGARSKSISVSKAGLGAAAVVTLVGFGASFGRVLPLDKSPTPSPSNNGELVAKDPGAKDSVDPDTDTNPNKNPARTDPGVQLPSVFRTRGSEVAGWVGTAWSDIELSKYVPATTTDLTRGRVHIIFYRRSCDHCEEMFQYYLTGPLPIPVVAVEVPETRTQMRDPDNTWEMPETQVEHQQMAIGPDWVIITPVIVTLEDGIVQCAEQGDHETCYYFFE